jgi:hypothetical protein
MSGEWDEIADKTYMFAIDVTPASTEARNGASWRVLHRFSDFQSLKSDLGTTAANLKGAPFATGIQGSEDYGYFIIDRRKTLEVWLQHILKHPLSREGSWRKRLQKFLHPSAGPERYDGEKDQLVDEADLEWIDVGISMSGKSDRVEGRTHIFAIDVTSISGRSWTVMHRFNDFSELRDQLGDLTKTMHDAPFPPKHKSSWQNYDEFLEDRRTALASWLQAVVKHRHSKGLWAKPLKEFLQSSYIKV